MVGNTYYSACKNKETNKVFALIALTSVSDGELYYKDMEENMHPYAYDCPQTILDLLTETDNELANEWRQLNRKRIEEKKASRKTGIASLGIGSIIKVVCDDEILTLQKMNWYGRKRPIWKIMGRPNFMRPAYIESLGFEIEKRA